MQLVISPAAPERKAIHRVTVISPESLLCQVLATHVDTATCLQVKLREVQCRSRINQQNVLFYS